MKRAVINVSAFVVARSGDIYTLSGWDAAVKDNRSEPQKHQYKNRVLAPVEIVIISTDAV